MYGDLDSYYSPSASCSFAEPYRQVKFEDNETCRITNSLDSFYYTFLENDKHCNNTNSTHEPKQELFESQYVDESSSLSDDDNGGSICLTYLLMSPYTEPKNASCNMNSTCIPIIVFSNSDECYCNYKQNKQKNETIQCLCQLNKANTTINGTEQEDECRSIRRNCTMYNNTEDPDEVFYNCTTENTNFFFESTYFNESGKGYIEAQCSSVNSINDSHTIIKSLSLFLLLFHLFMHFVLVKKEYFNVQKKRKRNS